MSKKKVAIASLIAGSIIGLGAGIAGTIGFKKLKRSNKLTKLKSFIKDIKKNKQEVKKNGKHIKSKKK